MKACNPQVHLAFPQGPCLGVKRSIEIARRLLAKGVIVYALHPLVHNEIVMSELTALGLVLQEDVEQIPQGATVLLSAHGTPQPIVEKLRAKGCQVVDAVCPLVLYVHKVALRATAEGGKVNVVGDPQHIEIQGLLSRLPEGSYLLAGPRGERADPRYPLVFQSTTDPEVLKELQGMGFQTLDTICFATKGRQGALRQLLDRCDAVVVLGSQTSANSRHLLEKVVQAGKHGLLTLNPGEAVDFAVKFKVVGLIAGASTPLALVFSTYERIMRAYEEICDHRSS
ncbi:LytB protein [Coprothermobacteraceae bacterium]|nr:LytB protein [Coprothermobacteraceae bacterium]